REDGPARVQKEVPVREVVRLVPDLDGRDQRESGEVGVTERRVLVTGGAGFVGSHLVDALLRRGDSVRVFDNLDPQVHGAERRKPAWLSEDAEFVLGDIRAGDAVARAIHGVDVIYHLAAAVGV